MFATQRRESVNNDDDDDDVSLNSTEISEHEDQMYEADRILNEKNGKHGRSYLILWDGYPLEEATWEPRKHLPPEVLSAWGERKKREAKGVDRPFDMADYNNAVKRAQERKADRHRRRKIKRKQLGYAVSGSEDEGRGEAMEIDDEVEDIPGSARSGVDPKKPRKRLVPRSRMQSLDDSEVEEEDTASNDPKTSQKSNASKTAVEPKQSVSSRISKHQRTSSTSSSDTPLATFRRDAPVSKLSTSQFDKAQRVTAQKKPISKVADASLTKRPGSSASESANDLFSSKDTLPAGRGRGAIRGGGHRSIFTTRKPAKKRPTLLQTSTDPTKGTKHYGNMHIRRKAELAGRALQDAAPNLEQIGGLYNPANPSNLQNLKVSDLRKASSSAAAPSKQVTDATRDNFSASEKNDSSTFQMPIEHFPTLARVRKICFFWDTKRNCQHGSGCELLHTNEPGIPIADPPRGYIARPQTIIQETPLSNQASGGHYDPFYDGDASGRAGEHGAGANSNYKIDVICYFWFRDNYCKKGEDCQYLHTNDPSKPVASDPQRDPNPQPQQHQSLTADEDYEPSLNQGPPFTNAEPVVALGHPKAYHHLRKNDSSKPIAPKPRGYVIAESDLRSKSKISSSSELLESSATAPVDGRKGMTCVFWKRPEGCKFTADECKFLHGYPPPPSSKQEEISSNLTGPSMESNQTSTRVRTHKSVSFAIDEPMPLVEEPQNMTPEPRPQHVPQRQGVCHFWLRNDCHHGAACWWEHPEPAVNRHESFGIPPKPIGDSPPASKSTRLRFHNMNEGSSHHTHLGQDSGTEATQPPVYAQSLSHERAIRLIPNLTSKPPEAEADPIVPKVKRAKMLSIEDYKRKNAIKSQAGRAKMIIFGGYGKQAIQLDTGNLASEIEHSWGQKFNSLPSIQFDQMCMAQDFRAMLDVLVDRALWKGDFLPVTTGDSVAAKTISTIAEELQDKSSALLSVLPDFVIITYPTKSDKIWTFLDDLEIPCDQAKESTMRYLVFEPKIQLASTLVSQHNNKSTKRLSSNLSQQYRKDLVHSIHKLPTSGFLPHSHKKYDGNPHNYFLLFPPSATKSLVFLTSWLRTSYPGCRFFGNTSGSWEYFLKSDTTLVGVVLIHESIISEISRLPNLNQIIMKSKRGIDFWCISDSTSKYPMYLPRCASDNSTLGLLTATRLFPHGSVFLLTPSFVTAEPEKALQILNWFFGKDLKGGKLQSATSGTWKLVCCYKFSDYLLDLANSKAYEREKFNEANKDKDSKDAEATQKGLGFEKCSLRYSLYAFFTKVEREWGQVDAMNDGVDFYSGIYDEDESPIIYADRHIDCDNEKALVEWFAGWSLCRLNKFRRLFVIGTGSYSQPRLQRLKQFSSQQEALKERPIVAEEATLNPEKQRALAIAAKLSAAHKPQASRNPSTTIDERTTISKAPGTNESLDFDAQYRALISSELSKTPAAASADELTPLEKLEAQWNERCTASPAKYRWIMKSNTPTRQKPIEGTKDRTLLQNSNWYLKELMSDDLREIIPIDQVCEHVASRGNILQQLQSIERFSDWWLDRYAGASREDLIYLAGYLPLQSLRRTKKPEPVLSSPEKKDQPLPKLTTEHIATANTNAMSPSTLNSAFSFQYQSPDYTRASEPFHFDGAGDARPASPSTDSSRTSRAGIQSDENHTRFVPRSVRPSGTVREEIPVKPGYVPPEDKDAYRTPAHRAGTGMSPMSNDNSRVVSNAASPSDVSIDMDVDSSPNLFVSSGLSPELEIVEGMLSKQEKAVGAEPPNKEPEWKEIKFEPTSAWYRELKENGGGWEHISVSKWDEAFYLLGVK